MDQWLSEGALGMKPRPPLRQRARAWPCKAGAATCAWAADVAADHVQVTYFICDLADLVLWDKRSLTRQRESEKKRRNSTKPGSAREPASVSLVFIAGAVGLSFV